MVDLSTTYLGLELKSPLVASASPLSKKVENAKRLEDSGAAAVVVYSLFEEQIVHESLALDYYLNQGTESSAEYSSIFPDLGKYNVGVAGYLTHIANLKKALQIPVIGSLNGISNSGWIEYAQKIQEAGADALELNLYSIPTDLYLPSAEIEENYLELVQAVRGVIRIPLAVKLSPFFTSLPNFARRLEETGVNGLVLFNRFYQPDLDIETLEVVPNLSLSTSDDLRLPLRWVAILHKLVPVDLALTGGVHTAVDALKAMMAGANVVMLASELLAHGPKRLEEIATDMRIWMDSFEYASVAQMRGSMSQRAVSDPSAFERGQYMKALQSFDHQLP